jgi:hypothetical protein
VTDRERDTIPAKPLDGISTASRAKLLTEVLLASYLMREALERIERALERVEANAALATEAAQEVNQRMTLLEQRFERHVGNGAQ